MSTWLPAQVLSDCATSKHFTCHTPKRCALLRAGLVMIKLLPPVKTQATAEAEAPLLTGGHPDSPLAPDSPLPPLATGSPLASDAVLHTDEEPLVGLIS